MRELPKLPPRRLEVPGSPPSPRDADRPGAPSHDSTGRGAGVGPTPPASCVARGRGEGACRGRKRSACASDREGRKEAVKGAWGRGAGWRPPVARRWPVASRRTLVGGVGSKAMLLLSLQGSVDGWTSSSRGGPSPRRAARHDRLVKVEGPRFSAWLSASSPSRRRPPLCAAPFRLGCQCKPVRMVREDEHTTQPVTCTVPCYVNSRRRTRFNMLPCVLAV